MNNEFPEEFEELDDDELEIFGKALKRLDNNQLPTPDFHEKLMAEIYRRWPAPEVFFDPESPSPIDSMQYTLRHHKQMRHPVIYAWMPDLYETEGLDLGSEAISRAEEFLIENQLFQYIDPHSRNVLKNFIVSAVLGTRGSNGASRAGDTLLNWFKETEKWLNDKLEQFVIAVAWKSDSEEGKIYKEIELEENYKGYIELYSIIYRFDILYQKYSKIEYGERYFSFSRPGIDDIRIKSKIRTGIEIRNSIQHGDDVLLVDWRKIAVGFANFLNYFSRIHNSIESVILDWQENGDDFNNDPLT